jgi:hypothetical protein
VRTLNKKFMENFTKNTGEAVNNRNVRNRFQKAMTRTARYSILYKASRQAPTGQFRHESARLAGILQKGYPCECCNR